MDWTITLVDRLRLGVTVVQVLQALANPTAVTSAGFIRIWNIEESRILRDHVYNQRVAKCSQ